MLKRDTTGATLEDRFDKTVSEAFYSVDFMRVPFTRIFLFSSRQVLPKVMQVNTLAGLQGRSTPIWLIRYTPIQIP